MESAPDTPPNTVLHDETRLQDGSYATNWQRVTEALAALSDEQIVQRQTTIARQLRANGIAYSPLSDADHSRRPWSLDIAPFVVEPDDWRSLSVGLKQRATLKEALLKDIYGEQSLLRRGIVPPTMVYAHQGYLRDVVNRNSSSCLPMYSADISRSPSGEWYVVDDICQFPEGIGYALENRMVLARTMSWLFRQTRVTRIASYFKQLQQYITEVSETDGRCVMLAPGPASPHYFEYAYLAKYLGYTLVQTGDLTVRDNHVYLKTVSGLQRLSVILRFIDDTALDPLAIGQGRSKGISGLFQAARTGGVKLLNPLGAGVLNNPALNSRMPAICEALLGEKLLLKGPPTYWLGDTAQLDHVNTHRNELLFRDIDSLGQLYDPQLMNESEYSSLDHKLAVMPHRYVAQERIDRSVAPAYRFTESVQMQITLRTYLVRRNDGYEVLPGGLCLLDSISGGRRPAFDSLNGSKDTWVISEGPVQPTSLLKPQLATHDYAVIDGELPSRVAENLFWMGRNAERTETTVRLLRSVFKILQNEDVILTDNNSNNASRLALNALLRATTEGTGTQPGFVGRGGAKRLRQPDKELLSLLHDAKRVGSLPYSLNTLQNSAAAVRDRVSDELLQVLNQLDDACTQLVDRPTPDPFLDDVDRLKTISDQLDQLLLNLSAYAGLAQENFTHGDGWRFMMLGRRLERIRHTATIISTVLSKHHNDVLLLETLLKLFDSVMTYRSRYRSQIDIRLVLQLLLVDEFNPRSLAFLFREIDETITKLPGRRLLAQADPLSRLAIAGLSRTRLADPGSLLSAKRDARQNLTRLLGVLASLPDQMAELLSATYFAHVDKAQSLDQITPMARRGSR